MPGELVPIIVVTTFFGCIAYVAKVIGDTRIRRKVLERDTSADMADALLNRGWKEPSTRAALKWGLVIVALGAGLLLVELFGLRFESPVAYAVLLLSTGTALLGYYLIEHEEGSAQPVSDSSSPATESVRSPEEVHDPEL